MDRKTYICLAFAAVCQLAGGCTPSKPEPEKTQAYVPAQPEPLPLTPEEIAEIDRLERIKQTRRKNRDVNWMLIGISTGKFSESISGAVFKTVEECEAAAMREANVCAPVAALPASYWDAKPTQPKDGNDE